MYADVLHLQFGCIGRAFSTWTKKWTDDGIKYFSLKVKGDSMFPKYIEGDIIIVGKQDCIILPPFNSAYDPKIYDYNDSINPVNVAGGRCREKEKSVKWKEKKNEQKMSKMRHRSRHKVLP